MGMIYRQPSDPWWRKYASVAVPLFKDSKDFIQESTISYIHQEYVVCYD